MQLDIQPQPKKPKPEAKLEPQKKPRYEKGQGLTEYLILLVLISLVSIAAVKSLGSTIQRKLQMVRDHINKVSPEK